MKMIRLRLKYFVWSLLTQTLFVPVDCITLATSTGDFQNFIGSQIDAQTYLTNFSIPHDQGSLCAYKCLGFISSNGSCFAAQYIKGSYVCQLQLSCGVVSLKARTDASVYVPGSIARNSASAVRPHIFLPLVQGCDPTFTANYGSLPVSGSMSLLGNPGYIANLAYPTMLRTLWFPSTAYPATTYAEISDTNGSLDFLHGSWTVSFMLSTNTSVSSLPVMSFFAGSPNVCVAFRMSGRSAVWFNYDASCSLAATTQVVGQMTTWPAVNGWIHSTFTYNNLTGTVSTYMNGAINPATAKINSAFAKYVSIIQFGACNGCTNVEMRSTIGTMACLQILRVAATEAQVMQLYNQCVNGVVLVN